MGGGNGVITVISGLGGQTTDHASELEFTPTTLDWRLFIPSPLWRNNPLPWHDKTFGADVEHLSRMGSGGGLAGGHKDGQLSAS